MRKILLAVVALLMLAPGTEAKTTKKVYKKKARRHTAAKPTYYYNSDGTLSTTPADAQRPSPYNGDRVPENDGVKKNQQRNLNYNSGQALPPNNGNR